MGKLVGPLSPSNGFHVRRSDAARIGQPVRKDLQCFGEFQPRQIGAEAVMCPAAERQVWAVVRLG